MVAWAEAQGVDPVDVEYLRRAVPARVKEFARARGLDPQKFLDPDVTLDGGAPATPATMARGVGGGPAPRSSRPAGGSAGPAVARPAWERAAWAEPGLVNQIRAALELQGEHRDERSLLAGRATKVTEAFGGTNETSRVTFDNGMVGYHKPFSGLNDEIAVAFGQSAAEQSIHEFAAWNLARELGEPYHDLVPPCVLREVNGELGSLGLERPGRTGADYEEAPEWRDAAFFDALIGQQDRHRGNFLMAGSRLTLIDHGYCFARPGDYENFSVIHNGRAGDVITDRERAALDRLTRSPDLLGLARVLAPDRAAAVLKRARTMQDTGRMPWPGAY